MVVTTCLYCGGDGYINDNLCEYCYGTGSLPPLGISAYTAKDTRQILKKTDDILDKCNDILNKLDDVLEALA